MKIVLHFLAAKFENQPSTFDPSVLDVIPDWDTAHGLMEPLDISEVYRAVNQMASGKAPGSDGLPPELFKSGGPVIIDKLLSLYTSLWSNSNGTVPQEFKDARIVHIFTYATTTVGSPCYPSLAKSWPVSFSTGSCSMSMTMTYYLKVCGGRSTMDMIFTARQLQEKCREQQQELYAVFVDLTQPFGKSC